MAILVPSWRYGGAPENASPTWSTACSFNRSVGLGSPSTCLTRVFIEQTGASFPRSSALYGGWWSGEISLTGTVSPHTTDTCGSVALPQHVYAGIDGGVYQQRAYIIDVWQALIDGLWSSSVSFDFRLWNSSAGSNTVKAAYTPNGSITMSGIYTTIASSSKSCPVDAATVCGAAAYATWTLVAYDDGTITFS